MQKRVTDRSNWASPSSRARSLLDGFLIGTFYSLAAILGVVSAQRTAAPHFSIPEKVILGLFIGIALWAGFSGFSIGSTYSAKPKKFRGKAGLIWMAVSFLTSTVIPLLYYFFQNGRVLILPWINYPKLFILSSLSFGLGGSIIGISALVMHHFYWRFLKGLRWGISLASALSFLIGLSAGWAAYGWTVFSSEFLLGLNILL
jgi:hypothetical protein